MSGKALLRIGLLIDSFVQPAWVYKLISDIQSSSIAEIVLIIKNDGYDGTDKRTTIIQKVLNNKKDLLYILYRKFDRLVSRANPDAFQPKSIEKLVSNCPIIHAKPLPKGYSDYFQEQDIAAAHKYNLDVALRLGFRIIRGPILGIAKYGVWSYHHGDNLVNRGGPPGFWEVMEDHPVTGSILQILSEELDGGKVIYRSYAATHKHSVTKNRNNYYWKSVAFVMRKLKELYEYGPETLDNDAYSLVYQPYSKRLYKQPSNAEMFRLFIQWCGKYALTKIQELFYLDQWFLAYKIAPSEGVDDTFYQFKSLIPPKDRYWADAFPVKNGNKYFIFIEEFIYKTGKGHIAVIEMDHKGVWKQPVKVLERDYHLSYPFIFQWQDDYYMIPETAANKTIELYRCTSFPLKWELHKVLMTSVNAVDATLAEINGRWWMFVNIGVDGASKDDELHLFYTDNPLGPWTPHKHNPVKSDVRSARPAGRIFQWNGHLYRPTQDCSKTYGYATSLNKVVHLDVDSFCETEVSKILPEWKKNMTGTHILNNAHKLTIIDGQMKRSRFF